MLLQLVGVGKSFANEIVLEGVSFRVDRREKVALVGRNGTGKTTLLKMIIGEMLPDGGSIQLAKGAKIGYLRQESKVATGRTVLQEVQNAQEERLELRKRLDELEFRLEHDPSDDELAEYATLHEHYLEMEGYSAERDVRTVLQKMGFGEETFDTPVDALSGGEKTRLALARLLLEEPDLLILDEPTNHLDLQATEWLETWLQGYPGAVLLVSHDRTFLQRTAQRFLHLEGGSVKSFAGPFEKYLQLRAADLDHQRIVAQKQDEAIAKLDEFVRRFMNSQRTAQARGRLKQMTKLVETKVHAPTLERGMKGAISSGKRSGDIVFETKKLGMAFGDRHLFRDLDLTVRRGDRIGVIGSNGSGKSTLLKNVLGKIEPVEGSVRLGANVVVGLFSQDTVDLDPDVSPIDAVIDQCGLQPQQARDLLGRFLLTGDDPFRKIKTLSGGEKNKVALAMLTTLHPNLLVLDEPTNHLDMDSREALAQILQDYDATLVLISHDRWLLEQVTSQTWDLKSGQLTTYPGNYADYVARNRGRAKKTAATLEPEAPKTPSLSPRELSKEKAKLAKLVSELEQQVAEADAKVAELEERLSVPPTGEELKQLLQEHERAQTHAENLLHEWAERSDDLEQLESA